MKFSLWLVSGVYFIAIGLLQLLSTLGAGVWDLWSLYGPAYILLGIGLFKKMKPAFWTLLVLALISLVQPIIVSNQGGESTGFSLFDIASPTILAILWWFQIRKAKK